MTPRSTASGTFGRVISLTAAVVAGAALGFLSEQQNPPQNDSRSATSKQRGGLLIVALVAAAAMLLLVFLLPKLAAAGWLIAFVFASAVPLGSLALLMIHRLTGGRWGEALSPMLAPAALTMPVVAILFIPALVALPLLYPWVAGSPAVMPSVAHFYLNIPLFVTRTVIAFIAWSVLALLIAGSASRSAVLIAALGLAFHALAISLLSVDWILSAEPVFISTSFGASLAIMQLLAALAFAALAAPRNLDNQSVRDLGGLLLAVTLGLTYIDFMAVLVIWYGDLPHKVDFFVKRADGVWRWIAIATFLLTSLIPVLALLLERVRASLNALRWIAASILCGLALYVAWLLAPVYGPEALATAPLAAIAICCALLFLTVGKRPASDLDHVRVTHD